MSDQVIAVDIDEVLALLHKPFLEHHNATYGTKFVYPDPDGKYYLEQFTGESSDTAETKIKAFVDHPSFQEVIEPLPGAAQVTSQLKNDGYRLHIITGRQPFYQKVTDLFLDRFFAGIFESVNFIPHFVGSALSPAQAKLDICARLGASYLIDDNLGTALAAAKGGLQAILFGDYQWNKHDQLPSGVTRCKDWPAVLEYFDGQR